MHPFIVCGTGFSSCVLRFMPPPVGARGIVFSGYPSVRPSVRQKPEILSFHLYMGPLVYLPNRDRFAACQSVRLSIHPERFPGIWRRMFGGNGHKSCMLMYLGHLQNWLDYGHGLLIYQILAPFDFVKRVKCEVSGYLPENAWREWPGILHVDVSGQPSVNGSNLGFLGICRRTHGGGGGGGGSLDILYADVSCPPSELISLFIRLWLRSVDFLLFVRLRLSETGQFCILVYLIHLQNWLVYYDDLVIFHILPPFYVFDQVNFGVSRHFSDNA